MQKAGHTAVSRCWYSPAHLSAAFISRTRSYSQGCCPGSAFLTGAFVLCSKDKDLHFNRDPASALHWQCQSWERGLDIASSVLTGLSAAYLGSMLLSPEWERPTHIQGTKQRLIFFLILFPSTRLMHAWTTPWKLYLAYCARNVLTPAGSRRVGMQQDLPLSQGSQQRWNIWCVVWEVTA